METSETKSGWHAPATVDEEILEFSKDETFEFEEQPPRAGFIAAVSAIVLGFILFCMFALTSYWNWYYDLTTDNQSQFVSEELQKVQAKETEMLGTYKYLDKDKGIVQIPIADAMKLVAKDAAEGKYGQTATSAAATSAAATTPASASAPPPPPPPAKPAATPAAKAAAAPAKK